MSTHICSSCGHEEHIFGAGGGDKMCKDYSTELLGSLPLDIKIREQTDAGRPTVVADPDGQVADIYRSIARRIAVKVDELSQDYSELFAKIVIEDN
jgi:ATP-binding protein involved in chromosome partitioning